MAKDKDGDDRGGSGNSGSGNGGSGNSGPGNGGSGNGNHGNKKYKIQVENEVYEWDSQFITGAQVRTLGPGIPENMDLFLKLPGKPGRLVRDEDVVDLDEHNGIEKFYAQDSASEAGAD
jgi:hypothetical protein